MSMELAAREMLNRGIQCVPLDSNKKPIVSFKDITITDEFIDENLQAYQSTTVLGVLTRGIWCIDIDIDHVEGVSGFESLKGNPYLEELTENINNTLVQTTPSGGKHIIFLKSERIEVYRQKIGYLPGVDIKAHPNNYFVLAGSRTVKGLYTHNKKNVTEYDGEFEERIFGTPGSFERQTREKYSIKNVLHDWNFSHLEGTGQGGQGKQAYQRIIDQESSDRNNDLYLAATYAKQYNIDLEPLKVLIGDIKGGDEFTESEWTATVESANSN